PDGAARDVLAEPGGERRGTLWAATVDVAEPDQATALVRDLDPDGLLAGDRSQDADLRRSQGIGEVVLELRDLRDLRAWRELELVAAHVRTGHRPDHPGLDPEMAERLEQGPGDLLVVVGVGALVRRALLEHP